MRNPNPVQLADDSFYLLASQAAEFIDASLGHGGSLKAPPGMTGKDMGNSSSG